LNYRIYIFKRKLENCFIFPFIALGRVYAKLNPLKNNYTHFFFFPFYHTGGAEQVHAAIAENIGNKNCIIFFTKKSINQRYLQHFQNSGCSIKNISVFTDNKWLYPLNFIYRGIVSGYINCLQQAVVLNGQCNFGYKISPWLNPCIKQVELIHSFNSFSWIRIPFLPFIHQTIMISSERIKEHQIQYKKIGIPDSYHLLITHIPNAIKLPAITPINTTNNLRVLFVGRGGTEKRPELFIAIAKQLEAYTFTLVGNMPPTLLENLPSNIITTGNVNDFAVLEDIYRNNDVLIIPSSTEGFPLVFMEAMARGCAVVATPVGDIPLHLFSNYNGLLLSSINPEIVVKETCNWLSALNTETLIKLKTQAQSYAHTNFGQEKFIEAYKTILQLT
jgi:L-malate glycosyltransferase